MKNTYESMLRKKKSLKRIQSCLLKTAEELKNIDIEIEGKHQILHQICLELYADAKYSEEQEELTTAFGLKLLIPIITLLLFICPILGASKILTIITYIIINLLSHILVNKLEKKIRNDYKEYRFIRRDTISSKEEIIKDLQNIIEDLYNKRKKVNYKRDHLKYILDTYKNEVATIQDKLLELLSPLLDKLIAQDIIDKATPEHDLQINRIRELNFEELKTN